VGRKAGLTDEKLRALVDFEESPHLDEREKLVLGYTVAMTETPVQVADEVFDQLKRQFNERQLVELTSAIAWKNYRAWLDHAFGIAAEGFSEGAFCPVPNAIGRN
jgi:alkylhydroperoxidase family enzyme